MVVDSRPREAGLGNEPGGAFHAMREQPQDLHSLRIGQRPSEGGDALGHVAVGALPVDDQAAVGRCWARTSRGAGCR